MRVMSETREIGVFSLDPRQASPLAVGMMVQPWMVLVRPPMDDLAATGGGHLNGTLRVLVAPIDDPTDAVTGTVAFEDALDQGLLAVVQLDRDVSWPYQPIGFGELTDEEGLVHTVHRHLQEAGPSSTEAESATLRSKSAAGVTAETTPFEAGGPTVRAWSELRPNAWPDGRSWPPSGDALTHWGICSIIPCCWGCPRNPRCVAPPKPIR